jgi:hypothetical protein
MCRVPLTLAAFASNGCSRAPHILHNTILIMVQIASSTSRSTLGCITSMSIVGIGHETVVSRRWWWWRWWPRACEQACNFSRFIHGPAVLDGVWKCAEHNHCSNSERKQLHLEKVMWMQDWDRWVGYAQGWKKDGVTLWTRQSWNNCPILTSSREGWDEPNWKIKGSGQHYFTKTSVRCLLIKE